MLAFEVSVNGKHICTASTLTHCVVGVAIDWAHDRLRFNIGGVASDDPTQHSAWKTPALAIGDEVAIRLIDTESYDQPDERYAPVIRDRKE